MRSSKIVCHPDGPEGPKVLVMHFHKPNARRFDAMTKKERLYVVQQINAFQERLIEMKAELLKKKP